MTDSVPFADVITVSDEVLVPMKAPPHQKKCRIKWLQLVDSRVLSDGL
jgi:hypothetical protein